MPAVCAFLPLLGLANGDAPAGAEGLPDWLRGALHHDVHVTTRDLLLRLGAAFVLGCVAAGIYRLTARPGHAPGLPGTLVLLSVLIALVTLVIGNSIARAFSLVGALAIVRFRTVVEDTRDTAFVIFAVASGMACGAAYAVAALVSAPLVLLAAWLFRPKERRREKPPEAGQRLLLRLGTATKAEQAVQALLKSRVPGYRLSVVATARGGAALDVTFAVPALSAEEVLALVAELNRVEGVQAVEWKGGA
jgi:uncharacterized membrane protein YhiD involved in acid resistance